MLNRKGAVLGEELPFWIFYMVYTGIIITAVVFIPMTLLAETSKTYTIENAIFNERVYNQLGSASLLTDRAYPGHLNSRSAFTETRILGAFETTGTPRELAFKVSLDGKDIYHKQDLHIRGSALKGGGYERLIEKRALLIESEDQLGELTIDQVLVTGGLG